MLKHVSVILLFIFQTVQRANQKVKEDAQDSAKDATDKHEPEDGNAEESLETELNEEAEAPSKPETLASKLTRAKTHAQPVKLEDGRDWVHLYKFLSQKPDVAVLGKSVNVEMNPKK